MRHQSFLFLLFIVLIFSVPAEAQDYTIVIKGGHLIDSKNNINELMDIAIKDDKVVLVAKNIDARQAQVINATGLYVTPGLIDIHSHNFFGTQEDHYLGDGFEALP
jgi:dihydroorotase